MDFFNITVVAFIAALLAFGVYMDRRIMKKENAKIAARKEEKEKRWESIKNIKTDVYVTVVLKSGEKKSKMLTFSSIRTDVWDCICMVSSRKIAQDYINELPEKLRKNGFTDGEYTYNFNAIEKFKASMV